MVTKNIVPGDSKIWRLDRRQIFEAAGAPADVAMTAYLRTVEGKLIELEIEDKDELVVMLSPEESESLKAGRVSLILRLASSNFFRQSVVVDSLQVLPKIEEQGFDNRTEAERCLEQAEKALADFMSGAPSVRSYTIGSRSTTYSSVKELTDLVEYWRKRVYLERCAAAGVDPRTMLVEFV